MLENTLLFIDLEQNGQENSYTWANTKLHLMYFLLMIPNRHSLSQRT